MSAFAIYSFVITGLYIVSIAFLIMRDLLGKKGNKKDDVEVFNNDDIDNSIDDEHSIVVDESDDGYVIRQPGEEDLVDSDESGGVSYDDPPSYESPDEEDVLNQESIDMQADDDFLKSVQEQMQNTNLSYQDEYSSSDFAVILAQPISNSSKILRRIIRQ